MTLNKIREFGEGEEEGHMFYKTKWWRVFLLFHIH